MKSLFIAGFMACAACASNDAVDSTTSTSTGTSGGAGSSNVPTQTLGMNDVTMLVPMPSTPSIVLMRASDAGDDGTALVPRELFDRLNEAPIAGEPIVGPIAGDIYADLQIAAVRFDLCDRLGPVPCPDSDGRLRIVFQALFDAAPPLAVDAAVHAFYTIPQADFPALVSELRALSKIQNADAGSPLRINPALAASPTGEYATRLKKLVTKYAGTQSLLRLTFFAQPQQFGAIRWVFRGVEKQGDGFVEMIIPGIQEPVQQVMSVGETSFDVFPVADQPKGFALAVSETSFAAASAAEQQQALAALVAGDNPLTHTAQTVQCATCHIATVVMAQRAATANIDPLAVEDRYTASGYDLTVPSMSDRTLRALGWLGRDPLIAQRTANESAQVAIEMDSRFPP